MSNQHDQSRSSSSSEEEKQSNSHLLLSEENEQHRNNETSERGEESTKAPPASQDVSQNTNQESKPAARVTSQEEAMGNKGTLVRLPGSESHAKAAVSAKSSGYAAGTFKEGAVPAYNGQRTEGVEETSVMESRLARAPPQSRMVSSGATRGYIRPNAKEGLATRHNTEQSKQSEDLFETLQWKKPSDEAVEATGESSPQVVSPPTGVDMHDETSGADDAAGTSRDETSIPSQTSDEQSTIHLPGAYRIAGPSAQEFAAIADDDVDSWILEEVSASPTRGTVDLSANVEEQGPVDEEMDEELGESHPSLAASPIARALPAQVVESEEAQRTKFIEQQARLEQLEEQNRILREREGNAVVAELVNGRWLPAHFPMEPRRKRLCVIGLMVMALVIIVGVVVGVTVPQNRNEASFIDAALSDFLANVSFDGGEALRTVGTPQYRAVEWLSGNTNLANYTDSKKIQRYTLATLYYSMNGDSWTKNSLWLDDGDECDRWFATGDEGVLECTGAGQIVDIKLENNNLEGTLPLELALLSDSLVRLDLSINAIFGTIPTKMGLLSNMEDLRLYENELSGSIPSEVGYLTKLSTIGLSSNLLQGTIPSDIGLLMNLEGLRLFVNELSGSIPSEVGHLTRLSVLSLSTNMFTGTIPSVIGLLTDLEALYLYENALSGSIPSEIGQLTKLSVLRFSNNVLHGTIPSVIGLLMGLEDLRLHENELSGSTPGEVWQLMALSILNLKNNSLEGTIPSVIGLLTNMEELDLSENMLSGIIPSEIDQLKNTSNLVLGYNRLDGGLPTSVGLMTSLERLHICNNHLDGPLPTEIGAVTALKELDLSVNRLTGTIPNEIGFLSDLALMSLQDNRLSGTIPSVVHNMTNLDELLLYDNTLTGDFTCPDFITTCLLSCDLDSDDMCRVLYR